MPSLRDEITRTFLRLSRRGNAGGRSFRHGDRGSEDLPEGTELGSYRILSLLGEGGMGQVYLALDTHLDRKVALKLLPAEFTTNPVFLRRFQQEARTASALNHPNILTIFEFPEIAGRHIIVSEYVEGQTLRDMIDRGIELPKALDIMAQVASALAAAHAAGVVHRDLKPTNIMVRPDGYVKIIDFGLAKLTQRGSGNEAESWTLPGAVLGTIGYMSPEQARGDEIDARADIWSFGVILYEILARSRPFEGVSDSHVIVAILDDPPRPIPDAEKLPPGLIGIVQRALLKEKKARYQKAEHLLEDIHRVQSALGTPPRHSGASRRSKVFPVLPVAAACLALAAALSVWWWPMGGRWKVVGPKWFEIGSSRRLTFLGNVQVATISPDGKSVAYVAGSQGSETFHLLDLRSNAERLLPATPNHYLGLTFTPDSKTLYYVVKDMQQELGRLFSVPVAGIGSEPPSLVLEDLDSQISFSPSGDRFTFVRGRAEGNQEVNQILMSRASDPRNLVPLVSAVGTELGGQAAWSQKGDWFSISSYPVRLGLPTLATISLYHSDGRAFREFPLRAIRAVKNPVALDGGSLLAFAGMLRGGEQYQLAQLFLPTGEFRERGSDIVGLDSLSATANSRTLAAVRLDERASIWSVDKADLQTPRQLTSEVEKITSADWLGSDTLIFPSARSGSVNLAKLDLQGEIRQLGDSQPCVQKDPAAVPGERVVVYSSNCGSEGDDFNLWALDLANGKRRRLTSGSNFDQQPKVSPDGKWVYYTSWSSNIPSVWKVPVAGGVPVRLLRKQAEAPVVSPDGATFAGAVREDHGGWLIEIASTADGSVLQRLTKLPIGRPLCWSPDGMALDYADTDKVSAAIWRQPLAGGPAQLLLRVPEGTITSLAWNRSGTTLAYVRARDQKDAVLFERALKR